MARSGNVGFNVLQQKCCDPNKLRSRAIRVVALDYLSFNASGKSRLVGIAEPWRRRIPLGSRGGDNMFPFLCRVSGCSANFPKDCARNGRRWQRRMRSAHQSARRLQARGALWGSGAQSTTRNAKKDAPEMSLGDRPAGLASEMLLDKNGQVSAVILGVGGLLGIGEKNVAVPSRRSRSRSRAATATLSWMLTRTHLRPPPVTRTTARSEHGCQAPPSSLANLNRQEPKLGSCRLPQRTVIDSQLHTS
jgi:hypothetical protein